MYLHLDGFFVMYCIVWFLLHFSYSCHLSIYLLKLSFFSVYFIESQIHVSFFSFFQYFFFSIYNSVTICIVCKIALPYGKRWKGTYRTESKYNLWTSIHLPLFFTLSFLLPHSYYSFHFIFFFVFVSMNKITIKYIFKKMQREIIWIKLFFSLRDKYLKEQRKQNKKKSVVVEPNWLGHLSKSNFFFHCFRDGREKNKLTINLRV